MSEALTVWNDECPYGVRVALRSSVTGAKS
jgi:hypothetical protein